MKSSVLLLAALVASGVSAKTVYVNCQMDSYDGHDGTTPELAVETIVDGYKLSASGDTIEVAPGVYKKGYMNETHWWGGGRVYLGHKVYLHATQGPEVTIIEGEKDPDAELGCGPKSLRCFVVEGPDAAESVIEGFTIRGGRTEAADAAYPKNQGGAVFSSYGGYDYYEGPYFVGCVVDDCAGSVRAVSYGGTFVRSRIQNCAGLAGQYFSFHSVFVNSIITRTMCWNAEKTEFATLHFDNSKAFNCTFVDNAVYQFYPTTTSYLYNNIYSSTLVPEGGAAGYNEGNFEDHIYNSRVLIAPALGDIRLRAGATADVYVGNPDFLGSDTLTLPSGEAPFNVNPYIDYFGNPIPTVGRIAAGACQQSVAPVGGVVMLPTQMTSLTPGFPGYGNTYYYVTDKTASQRLYANYPAASGRRVVRYGYYYDIDGERADNGVVWPLPDDSTVILPPGDLNDALEVRVVLSTTAIRYADPAAPVEGADGSSEHPYPSLQQAVDEAYAAGGNCAIAVAKPGTYDQDVSTYDYSGFTGAKTRLIVRSGDVRITSEGGAAVTFLKGAPDPDTLGDPVNPGCGKGAVNAFTCLSSAQLQGFTVTDAYSGEGTDVYSPARGSLFTYGTDMYVTDCILTGNRGSQAAIGCGRYIRCKVYGNYGGLEVFNANTVLAGCEVYNNTLASGGYVVYGSNISIFNCSIANNVTWTAIGQAGDNYVYNSIVTDGGYMLFNYTVSRGCVYDGFSAYQATGGYIAADPLFIGKTTGDLRTFVLGPAATAGVGTSGEFASKKWTQFCQTDIHGNPIALNSDGTAVAGADMNLAHGVMISAPNGGIAVTGGVIGFNEASDDLDLTVAAVGGTRPVSGLEVNGVTSDFETLPDHQLTITGASGDLLIAPVLTTTWYCSPSAAANAPGGYPSAPRSLQGALSAAVSGDTVKAFAGTYDSGTMIQGGTYTASGETYPYAVRSRALVKTGVTLESTDGRAATIIKGAAATVEDEKYEYAEDGAGMGADAIRCVYLESGAKVKGFTITDGHTRCRLADGNHAHSHIETSGGGVIGMGGAALDGSDSFGTVEDCIITNCVAFRGAGVFCARVINSVLCGNTCCYIGGSIEGGKIYGSLIYGNKAFYPYIAANKGAYDLSHASHTTFFDHMIVDSTWKTYINCLCYKVSFNVETPQVFNCVFSETSGVDASRFPFESGNVIVPDDELQYDENYRPVVGHNAAVDFGSIPAAEAEPDFLSGPDVQGGQRIYNGTIDVGALEADWRGVYAQDLNKKGKVTVTAASPMVQEIGDEAKTVQVPNGATLEATVAATGHPFSVPVKVSGGILTVTVGEDASQYSEDTVIEIGASEALNVSFAYEGTGAAEIGRFAKASGLSIFVR